MLYVLCIGTFRFQNFIFGFDATDTSMPGQMQPWQVSRAPAGMGE